MADLALSCVARMRRQSDQMADVFFEDTHISYRDDNRHLWIYIEAGDEEESFDDPRQRETPPDVPGLPPRHYPEWDPASQTYRPDWVSLYERLQPSGNPADIHRILARHAALAKQLKRLLDLLKPQDKVRIRFQEEGSELDLDVAIRSLIDFKSGAAPDPRINMSHRTDGRDIAVLLLLDLSQSLNEPATGSEQTVLDLSREAVTLLAWAIQQLGDPFAIAGFHSNTRHDVRYQHIKGFDEGFDDFDTQVQSDELSFDDEISWDEEGEDENMDSPVGRHDALDNVDVEKEKVRTKTKHFVEPDSEEDLYYRQASMDSMGDFDSDADIFGDDGYGDTFNFDLKEEDPLGDEFGDEMGDTTSDVNDPDFYDGDEVKPKEIDINELTDIINNSVKETLRKHFE